MGRHIIKMVVLTTLAIVLCACTAPDTEVDQNASAFNALDGKTLMMERCAGCHTLEEGGRFSRISEQRKTPEGWFMSLVRMERAKRVRLNDDERRAIVKYLSDEHGLAPIETRLHRAALEKIPNSLDGESDPDLQVMCARCHSSSRIALQRRSEGEWRNLLHFHVAQFPTLEYQAGSRDRDWWRIAHEEIVPKLTTAYGLDSQDWSNWQSRHKTSMAGEWRVVSKPSGGELLQGTASIHLDGSVDRYKAKYALSSLQGAAWRGESEAQAYSGYEWRGALVRQGKAVREVFALSADGNEIRGRWFYQENDEVGGRWEARRMTAPPAVMRVYPNYLKPGETKKIILMGVNLGGDISLGKGLSYTVLSRSNTQIELNVTASLDLSEGVYDLALNNEKLAALKIYSAIDRVQVIPENAIARLGGGKVPAVSVQYEAHAYSNGPDGLSGTEDDMNIGVFPASWSKDNFDATAAYLEDSQFAGDIDQRGLFTPAEAGINPERYISTNNTGVLAIKANVQDGETRVTGQARLVVTVQRFIDPPIR